VLNKKKLVILSLVIFVLFSKELVLNFGQSLM